MAIEVFSLYGYGVQVITFPEAPFVSAMDMYLVDQNSDPDASVFVKKPVVYLITGKTQGKLAVYYSSLYLLERPEESRDAPKVVETQVYIIEVP